MRAAFSMTIDPEGAMHDWVDLPAGWDLLRVPTQELVHLVGPHAYQEALIDLCERERPEVLVTHPPYDWLDPATAARIRAAGTRLVAYAFDDEIFAAEYSTTGRAEIAQIYDRYVTTREVRWATRPLEPLPERPAQIDVVLVGRAYERRRALVQALRAAGIRVETRGLGWPEGFVSRAGMLDLYSRAAVVLTTADWEHRAVPMVKHRLLDTAMLGAFQIAQEAPDLRGYFDEDEVPSFAGADELVAKVEAARANGDERRRRAQAARARALAEHTWNRRFPELISGLTLEPQKQHDRSCFFSALVAGLASRAETEGRIGAAEALWREAEQRGNQDAPAALGRCLRDLGRHEEAVEYLRRRTTAATCAGSIHATLASHGGGVGLGRLGLLPPAAEPAMLLVASLVELGRIAEAAQVLDGLDGAAARAVAATLTLGDKAELAPLREALARLHQKSA
jgi:Glycosyl transferases group 1